MYLDPATLEAHGIAYCANCRRPLPEDYDAVFPFCDGADSACQDEWVFWNTWEAQELERVTMLSNDGAAEETERCAFCRCELQDGGFEGLGDFCDELCAAGFGECIRGWGDVQEFVLGPGLLTVGDRYRVKHGPAVPSCFRPERPAAWRTWWLSACAPASSRQRRSAFIGVRWTRPSA